MAIGTHLPYGITTGDRWTIVRWRRISVVCAFFALTVSGFVLAENAGYLMTLQLPGVPSIGVSAGTVEAQLNRTIAQSVSETPSPTAKSERATMPVIGPMSPSGAATKAIATPANATEPSGGAGTTAEAPQAPTVLRGSGMKQR